VTPAGENKVDTLGIKSMSGDTLLTDAAPLGENNRVPQLNIHAILRKTQVAPFRASLEIATAHAPVNLEMLERYQKGTGGQARAATPSTINLAELSAVRKELRAIKQSRSWRITRPLRDAVSVLRRLRGR
jgi:hypothetical protein